MLKIEEFEKLANQHGLVPMRIIDPFAPYCEGAVAGFPPERALFVYQQKAAVPLNADGDVVGISEVATPKPKMPPPSAAVEIPADWENLHTLQLVRIAKQITGMESSKMTEAAARDVIAAELTRRSNDHG